MAKYNNDEDGTVVSGNDDKENFNIEAMVLLRMEMMLAEMMVKVPKMMNLSHQAACMNLPGFPYIDGNMYWHKRQSNKHV